RSITAASERYFLGVPLHVADRIEVDAEPIRDQLRESCGVALTVRVRARDNGYGSTWIEADLHALVKHRRFFEEVRETASAQPAFALRCRAAFAVARVVGQLEAGIDDALELSTVVLAAGERPLRHQVSLNEIPPS